MQEGFESGGIKQKGLMGMDKHMVIMGSGYKGISGNKKYNKKKTCQEKDKLQILCFL